MKQIFDMISNGKIPHIVLGFKLLSDDLSNILRHVSNELFNTKKLP